MKAIALIVSAVLLIACPPLGLGLFILILIVEKITCE